MDIGTFLLPNIAMMSHFSWVWVLEEKKHFFLLQIKRYFHKKQNIAFLKSVQQGVGQVQLIVANDNKC